MLMTNLEIKINGLEVKPMKIYVDDFFDTITIMEEAKQNCDRKNVLSSLITYFTSKISHIGNGNDQKKKKSLILPYLGMGFFSWGWVSTT